MLFYYIFSRWELQKHRNSFRCGFWRRFCRSAHHDDACDMVLILYRLSFENNKTKFKTNQRKRRKIKN